MQSSIKDKHKFWQIAPAADEIFRYVKETPEISQTSWSFDCSTISDDLNSIEASFSFGSVTGFGNDKLHVIASRTPNGPWVLRHSLARVS